MLKVGCYVSLITSRFAPLPQLTSICSIACLDLSRSFHGHFHKYERIWRSLPPCQFNLVLPQRYLCLVSFPSPRSRTNPARLLASHVSLTLHWVRLELLASSLVRVFPVLTLTADTAVLHNSFDIQATLFREAWARDPGFQRLTDSPRISSFKLQEWAVLPSDRAFKLRGTPPRWQLMTSDITPHTLLS